MDGSSCLRDECLKVSDGIKSHGSTGRVVIRRSVIPRSLDVNSHQIPPGELHQSKNFPYGNQSLQSSLRHQSKVFTSKILDDHAILPFAQLTRHSHNQTVDIHMTHCAVCAPSLVQYDVLSN